MLAMTHETETLPKITKDSHTTLLWIGRSPMTAYFFTRSVTVNRCPPHRTILWLAVLLLTFGAAWPVPVPAHEGEDHGAPGSGTVAAPGETLLAASGSGSLFEAILKYRPFVRGETVAVTLYLVSAETNRPLADATVNATLSEGDRSTAVAFAPKPGGPVGAYSATLAPATAAPMSWLFEVTADGESDLIGVTGFQARPPKAHPAVGETALQGDGIAPPRWAVLIAIGALLLVVAFAAGRLTARGRASA